MPSEELITNKEMWENLISYYEDICSLMDKKRTQCKDVFNNVMESNNFSDKKAFYEEYNGVQAKLNKVQWILGTMIKNICNDYPKKISNDEYNHVLEGVKQITESNIALADDLIDEFQQRGVEVIARDVESSRDVKGSYDLNAAPSVNSPKEVLLKRLEDCKKEIENTISDKYKKLISECKAKGCFNTKYDDMAVRLGEIKSLLMNDLDKEIKRINELDEKSIDINALDNECIELISGTEYLLKHDMSDFDKDLEKIAKSKKYSIPSIDSLHFSTYDDRPYDIRGGSNPPKINTTINEGRKGLHKGKSIGP